MPRTPCTRRALATVLLGTATATAGWLPAAAAPLDPAQPAELGQPSAGRRSPSDGFRPIGAPSGVDGFSSIPTRPPRYAAPVDRAASGTGVVQTAFMQGGSFEMPPGGAEVPPSIRNGSQPAPAVTGGNGFATDLGSGALQAPPLGGESGPITSGPITSGPVAAPLQEGLQPVPTTAPLTAPPQQFGQPYSAVPSPSDSTPVPQPQLNSNWATVDNCNLVTPPSGYRAEFGCAAPPVMVPGAVAPLAYGGPVAAPPVVPIAAPLAAAPVGHRPLFTLGQEYYNVQLGQGIIGQPTAYVPGQYFRNFIRYLSP